jgi:hypothetical protein
MLHCHVLKDKYKSSWRGFILIHLNNSEKYSSTARKIFEKTIFDLVFRGSPEAATYFVLVDSCEQDNELSGSIKCSEVLEWLHNWQLLRKGSAT